MAKSSLGWVSFQKKWLLLLILVIFSLSTAIAFFLRSAFDSCDSHPEERIHFKAPTGSIQNPLGFMRSKLVLLVSHELSLSGDSLFYPPICIVEFLMTHIRNAIFGLSQLINQWP